MHADPNDHGHSSLKRQSFRTRKDRNLEPTTAPRSHNRPGRYTVAVKVIDIFGNDTMTLVSVNLG